MIRINYSLSTFTHLRVRLDLATRRTRRSIEERRRTLRTEAEARVAARNAYLLLRWRQDLVRERRLFETFYDQYDALVGLLCAAAHEGITPEREEKYRKRRAWFCSQYSRVKPMLAPYLEADPADTVTFRLGRRACDGFEALFLPGTLASMFAADQGNLIGRLMRAQTALSAWEERLTRDERTCEITPVP